MSIQMKTNNVNTEKKVLNLLLNNEEAIELALTMNLVADDFSTERNKVVFEAIVNIYVEQTIAVGDDLDVIISGIEYEDDEDKKNYIVTLSKLQKLSLSNGKPIQIKFLQTYIKELKDLSVVRKVIHCTQNITRCLGDANSSVEDLLIAVQSIDDEIHSSDDIVRMDMVEAVNSSIKNLVDEAESENNVRFFIDELDEKAKILRGYLTYIEGAPGIGKSAVTLNMANSMSDAGVRVGYFTLEMNIEDCVNRMISIREGIYSQRMQNPKLLKSSDWKIIEKILDDKDGLITNNIFWRGKPDMCIDELRSEITRLVKVHDIDVVLIDYYQLLKFEDGSTLPESIEIPKVSNALKTLASEYYVNPYGKFKKVFVVALSQVVKEVERREDKRPTMNDMYYGGSKDARLVVALYRDEYYYPDDTTKPNVMEFGIVKQNNGVMNEWVGAHFDSSTYKIRDLTDDERNLMDEDDDSDDDDSERPAKKERKNRKAEKFEEDEGDDYEPDED